MTWEDVTDELLDGWTMNLPGGYRLVKATVGSRHGDVTATCGDWTRQASEFHVLFLERVQEEKHG